MKIISKLRLFSAIIASIMMLVGANSFALKGNHKGVPSIGSMVIMSGLTNPWDLAFTKDMKAMFFTEKSKGLSVNVGGKTHKLVGIKGSEGYATKMDDLFTYGGQEGMLGVVLDNNFDKNRTLFLYSASSKYMGAGCKKDNYDSCTGNIVMKMTVAKDFKSVSNRVDIVKDIQFKPFKSDQPFGGPGAHNGGRMAMDKDGYLWVGTGDRHMGIGPQSPDLIAGKVLRIDSDGNAHPGNKFKGDKRVYTYGHRNVQGIAFRPSDGRAFTAEHGPWHNDEITALVNGGNGGWDPAEKRGGRTACPDKYCGYEPNQKEGMTPAVRAAYTPMSDTRFKDLMPPAWNNNGYSQGTGSAAFLKGSNWGIYEGRMVAGIMGIGFGGTPSGLRIDMYDISEDGQSINSVIHMPVGVQDRFRGLEMGSDNNLYATTDSGNIMKISAD
jgi:glucose/arabinose dehydrogenase